MPTTSRRGVSMLLLLIGVVCGAHGLAQSSNNGLAGTWAMKVTRPGPHISFPIVTLSVSGNTVTGRYQSSLGESDVTGTIRKKVVEFTAKVKSQEQNYTLTYKGMLESEESMKGTLQTTPGIDVGTFTAIRQRNSF